jgi:hypothetical protein
MKLSFVFNLINITYLLLSFLILTRSQLDLSTQTSTIAVACSPEKTSFNATTHGADCATSSSSDVEEEKDVEEEQEENEYENDYDDGDENDDNDNFFETGSNRTVNPVLNRLVSSSFDLNLLKESLLYMYDRKSRPLSNTSDAIQVRLGVSIAQINNLDEVYQVSFNPSDTLSRP